MLTSVVEGIIDYCQRHARLVVAIGVLLAIGGGFYAATHFVINSDINALLSKDLGWRQREVHFESEFRRYQLLDVVVEAPTPELTSAATTALSEALAKETGSFESVTNSSAQEFFLQHGLLFQSTADLRKSLAGLTQAEPLIQDLASDESLHGLISALEDVLIGVSQQKLTLDQIGPTLNSFSATLETILSGQPASFSWRVLFEGKPASLIERLGFIEVRPKLDFAALEPGLAATETLRRIAATIAPTYQASVRLTGPVAMSDDEFATIKENSTRNGIITFAIVLLILFLALRSPRLIAAVFINLFVGLPITAALGLMMVGSFNLISVYFAVLFVGIGIDFAIQYSVRYRTERHEMPDLAKAIRRAGFHVAAPLTLAGFATALGFFSFLPTDYKGVSELGLIAGFGMLIAFLTSITVLPALIYLLNPPGEPEPMGFTVLAPVDDFLARHRIPIIIGVVVVVVGGLPLLFRLPFDFNPIDLNDPKTEAVATYLQLSKDPTTNANAIELLAPNLDSAHQIAARVSKLPEVGRVLTLSTFIPDDQSAKLPLIAEANKTLGAAFDPSNAVAPSSDADTVQALNEGADRLRDAAKGQTGAGAEAATRLANALTDLGRAPAAKRTEATSVFIDPLRDDLDALHTSLQAQPLTQASLPPAIVRDWITPSGEARVSIAPSADPGNNEAMRTFAAAVLAVEPSATEGPISILEAGKTVMGAFITAGIWALVSIAILLWLVLRRLTDVLLTLIPLLMAGVVTLEICAITGMPLNFANIIAFPLLLGVGVAFKIYYIMAWREGVTHLLQSSLTRAVLFSALTTATAFGSLMFSSHPGTASLGKLLALSLITTLAAAVLFQPILMGAPRAQVKISPPTDRKKDLSNAAS